MVLEPQKIKSKITYLKGKYGIDVLQKAANLYFLCFSDFHSYEINKLSNLMKNIPLAGSKAREFSMIYTFLLMDIFSENKRPVYDDLVFVIYLTYYTGLLFDSEDELSYKLLQAVETEESSFVCPLFRSEFKWIRHYNFQNQTSGYGQKVKRRLLEKKRSFARRYSNPEQVESFLNYSRQIAKNGL